MEKSKYVLIFLLPQKIEKVTVLYTTMAAITRNSCEFVLHDNVNYEENDKYGELRFALLYNDECYKHDGDTIYDVMAALDGFCELMFSGYFQVNVGPDLIKEVTEGTARIAFTDNTKNTICIELTDGRRIMLENEYGDTEEKLRDRVPEMRLKKANDTIKKMEEAMNQMDINMKMLQKELELRELENQELKKEIAETKRLLK